MHRLGDGARGQNKAVGSFDFEFPRRKEQSVTSKYASSFRKQIVCGMERIPGSRTEKVIGGSGPQLVVY